MTFDDQKGVNFCFRYMPKRLSYNLPSPSTNIQTLWHFPPSFVQLMTECEECKSNQLQLNIWPLMASGFSLNAIGPHDSGKTVSYVLYILNQFWIGGFFNNEPLIRTNVEQPSGGFQADRFLGSKIYSIVITNSIMSSIKIRNEFQKWIKLLGLVSVQHKKNLRICHLPSTSHLNDYFDVVNGCCVLIATPSSMIRLIELDVIQINDTRILIIDNADQIDSNSMEDFLKICHKSLNDSLFQHQTFLFSRSWTKKIKQFFFQVQVNPILVFSSLRDATLIFNRHFKNKILFSYQPKNILTNLEQILCCQLKSNETAAVICTSNEQLLQLKNFIEKSEKLKKIIEIFVLDQRVTIMDMDHIFTESIHQQCHLKKVILLHLDDICNLAFCYRKFFLLIHVDPITDCLEQDRFASSINFRLWLLYEHFQSFFTLNDDLDNSISTPKISNYFLLSPNLHSQKSSQYFQHLLINLLEFCCYPLNYSFDEEHDLLDYIQNNIYNEICPEYASFSKCSKIDQLWPCWRGRHSLIEKSQTVRSDELPHIVENCQIKFRVLNFVNTNEFYVSLIAYRSINQPTGEWIELQDQSMYKTQINEKLFEFSQKQNPNKQVKIFDLKIGQIYGFYNLDRWLRVRVIDIRTETNASNLPIWANTSNYTETELQFIQLIATVFAIDVGFTIECKSFELNELSDELKSIPPVAYKVLLSDISPPDGGYSWVNLQHFQSSSTTENFLMQLSVEDKSCYLIGWILARSNRLLWLHKVMFIKQLKELNLNQTFCWKTRLIQNGLASKSESKFANVDYEAYCKVQNLWNCNRQRKLARFETFELVQDDDGSHHDTFQVLINRFESLNQIYVTKVDSLEKLNRLEQKWAKKITKLIEALNTNLHKYWTPGQICFHLIELNDQTLAKRCQINKIDEQNDNCSVTYLDYGNENSNVKLIDLYTVDDCQISQINFQAICLNILFDCQYTSVGKDNYRTLQPKLNGTVCYAKLNQLKLEQSKPILNETFFENVNQLVFSKCYLAQIFIDKTCIDSEILRNDLPQNDFINLHSYLNAIGFIQLNFVPDLIEINLEKELDKNVSFNVPDKVLEDVKEDMLEQWSCLFRAINESLSHEMFNGGTITRTFEGKKSNETKSADTKESTTKSESKDDFVEIENSSMDKDKVSETSNSTFQKESIDCADLESFYHEEDNDDDSLILPYDPYSSSSSDDNDTEDKKINTKSNQYEVINTDYSTNYERFIF